MTGELIFVSILLYSLGFMGSLLLAWAVQGEALTFKPTLAGCVIIAALWPVAAILVPVSVGLLAVCILASGEWRKM